MQLVAVATILLHLLLLHCTYAQQHQFLKYEVLRLSSNVTMLSPTCTLLVDEIMHVNVTTNHTFPLQYFSRIIGTVDAYDIFPQANLQSLQIANHNDSTFIHDRILQYVNTDKQKFFITWKVMNRTSNASATEFVFLLKYNITGFVDWNERSDTGSKLKFKWNIKFDQYIRELDVNVHIPMAIMDGAPNLQYTSSSNLPPTAPSSSIIDTQSKTMIVTYKGSNLPPAALNDDKPSMVMRIEFGTPFAPSQCPTSSMRQRVYGVSSTLMSIVLLIIVSVLTCCIHVRTPCSALLGFADLSKKDIFRTKKKQINKEKSNNKNFAVKEDEEDADSK